MSIKILANNALWSMCTHLMGRGSLVVAAMVLSNKLSTNDFAAYNYFQLTVSMLAAYAALGMGVTASRFFAEVGVVNDAKLQPLGTLWLLSIVVGVILSLAVLSVPSTLISGQLDIPSWLLALGVFVIIIGVVPGGGILGLEQYKKAAVFSSISAVVLIVGIFNLPESNSSKYAMLLFVLSMAIQSLGNSIVVLIKTGPWRILQTLVLDKSAFTSIFNFAGPMLLVSLMTASGTWLVGRIILSGGSGEYQFSLYSIGLQWFSLIMFIPGMMSRVLLPRLIRDNDLAKKQNNELTLTSKASILATVAAILAAVVGSFLSPYILNFYGDEYKVSTWFLVVFMLAAIPASPANTLGNGIVSRNGQWAWLGFTLVWFVCLIGFSLLFLSFGALAGAIAYSLSFFLLTLMAFVSAKKLGLL